MFKKHAIPRELNRQNLLRILPALQGIEAFAFFGTLLGLEREADVIDKDDDIDFLVNLKDRDRLIKNIEALDGGYVDGFGGRSQQYFYQAVRSEQQYELLADFYFYTEAEEDDHIVERWNFFASPNNADLAMHVPKDIIYPIETKSALGVEIPFPADPVKACHFLYGDDWNTPVASGKYKMVMHNNKPVFVHSGNYVFKVSDHSGAGAEKIKKFDEIQKEIARQNAHLKKLKDDHERALIDLIVSGIATKADD